MTFIKKKIVFLSLREFRKIIERLRVFFTFRFPDFITILTYVLIDNFCPCLQSNFAFQEWKHFKPWLAFLWTTFILVVPVKVNIEKVVCWDDIRFIVCMIVQGRASNMIPVLSDNPIHQAHLGPHYPDLELVIVKKQIQIV